MTELGQADSRPFAEVSRSLLRETILEAADRLVASSNWSAVTMAQVASGAGVSRQTVYNEFGDKWGVLQAVAARETERFLLDVNAALAEESDPIDGLRAAVERHLTAHPQVASRRLGQVGEGGRGVTLVRIR